MKVSTVEIWKDVKGFEGLYQVSSLGRVKSLNYRNKKGVEQILSIVYIHSQRQSVVSLCRNGVVYNVSVNRLIAETFITGANMNYDIIHKDGNYKNNSVDNLEVSTKKHGLRNQTVYCLDKETKEVKGVYKNQGEAACALMVTASTINHCIHKICKTSANHIWVYAA
jgi:hypothetical protein